MAPSATALALVISCSAEMNLKMSTSLRITTRPTDLHPVVPQKSLYFRKEPGARGEPADEKRLL